MKSEQRFDLGFDMLGYIVPSWCAWLEPKSAVCKLRPYLWHAGAGVLEYRCDCGWSVSACQSGSKLLLDRPSTHFRPPGQTPPTPGRS
jgi:hypothetical protein